MILIIQYAGNPAYIMVVNEGQEVPALIQGPVLRSKLAKQGMDDLKQIHTVHG